MKHIILFLILSISVFGQNGAKKSVLTQAQKDSIQAMIEAYTDTSGSASLANNILEVGSDRVYTTIASALSSASSGDVIKISNGTYTENISLVDGVVLLGEGDKTIIDGTITTVGNNQIYELKIGDLIIGSGDTVKVDNCLLYKKTTYTINQSGGIVDIQNSNTVFDVLEPSINVSGGVLKIRNTELNGKKFLITGSASVDIDGGNWSVRNQGNYCVKVLNTADLKVKNVWLYPVDASNVYTVPTTSVSFVAENQTEVWLGNLRCDFQLSIDDSAKFYLNKYESKYNGRFSATATTTNQAKIIARNFHIQMDNGFQGGSHCIEVASGGEAIFDLSDGMLEYMGDQGEYPMVGSVSAGGGTQLWNNITVIDNGGSSGYDGAMYGFDNARVNNLSYVSNDTTDKQMYAVSVIVANLNKFILTNSSFYFLDGNLAKRIAVYIYQPTTTLTSADSIYLDYKVYNGTSLANSNGTTQSAQDTLSLAYVKYSNNEGTVFADVTVNGYVKADTIKTNSVVVPQADMLNVSLYDSLNGVSTLGVDGDTCLVTIDYIYSTEKFKRFASADIILKTQYYQTDATNISTLYKVSFSATDSGQVQYANSLYSLKVIDTMGVKDSLVNYVAPEAPKKYSSTDYQFVFYIVNKSWNPIALMDVDVQLLNAINIRRVTISKI